MCKFELTGVCNDSNCPYLHQKDCEGSDNGGKVEDSSEENIESDAGVKALREFSLLRSDLQARWPPFSVFFDKVSEL